LMKWEGDRWYKYDFEVEVTDHTRSEWRDGIKVGLLSAWHGTIELFYGRLFQNIWGWVDYSAFFRGQSIQNSYQRGYTQIIRCTIAMPTRPIYESPTMIFDKEREW
jgi:hypothetical protein